MSGAWQALRHVLRCGRHLATSPDLPRWLRALLIFGALPVPGPLDDLCLIMAVGIMAVFYRPALRAAWTTTAKAPHAALRVSGHAPGTIPTRHAPRLR